MANPVVRNIAAVQDRHTSELMSIPGVVGTATGLNDAGELTVMVLTEHALGAGRLPATLEGIPVFEEVTGRIKAMAIADHQVAALLRWPLFLMTVPQVDETLDRRLEADAQAEAGSIRESAVATGARVTKLVAAGPRQIDAACERRVER